METIELDCAPGFARPDALIDGVLADTGLEVGDTVSRCFGNWKWAFDISRDEWVEKIQPIIKPRIEALYRNGSIRYGSW